MDDEQRTALTGGLWFTTSIALVGLFISAAAQSELTAAHVALASVILALAVIGTSVLLRATVATAHAEKAKRHRIDNLLRDMSDDDLIALRQRLIDDHDDHEMNLELSPNDGELVRRD